MVGFLVLKRGEQREGERSEHGTGLAGPAVMCGKVGAVAPEVETDRPVTTTEGDDLRLGRLPPVEGSQSLMQRVCCGIASPTLLCIIDTPTHTIESIIERHTSPIGTDSRARVVAVVVGKGLGVTVGMEKTSDDKPE